MEYKLFVNGFETTINFNPYEVEEIHRPIISLLTELYRKKNQRILCLYAAPPGTGKSTSTALWEVLSKECKSFDEVQTLSIDGFHYPNQYLSSHSIVKSGEEISLISIKGAPETYDVILLEEQVRKISNGKKVKWPYYDRNIHNPIDNAVEVVAPIIVVEGNWVLLKEEGWSRLKDYANFSVYHDAEEHMLRNRLIERKVRGGVSIQEAEMHYKHSDSLNIKRVRENHLEADATIKWNSDLNKWELIIL